MENTVFSKTQDRFIATFTEEFVRELQFIIDIDRGRAKARATFYEQLIGKINLGANVLGMLTSFFPAVSVAVGTASQVAVCVATGLRYIYEIDMNSNIQRVIDHSRQPDRLLRLMIEDVAREATRRHEFFLNNMCDPESVDLFAIVGVARILQYLSDNKDVLFTSQNLIKGLIEGKSGIGQQGFSNNQLKSLHPHVSTISAETVYGHSAHMCLNGRYYTKQQKKFLFRANDNHYVKMAEGSSKDLPKAGVMVLRMSEISHYAYIEESISAELDQHLFNYRPGYRVLNRSEIESYIRAQKNSKTPLSLIEYCGRKGAICRDDLSGLDLSGGDFSGVDFSGAKFCIKNNVKTKLNGANFEKACLVSVDFSHVEAKGVNFRHANLSLVNAEKAYFEGSDFIHAQIFYSCFAHANMTNIKILGSEWCGSDLSTIKTNLETTAELTQLSDETRALSERQDEQETRLIHLEKMMVQHKENQECHLEKSVAAKLKQLSQRVLDDENLIRELELYIPVRASLSSHLQQHFDLDEKVSEFLDQKNKERKVMLLLGGAGEGKSTYNRYLFKKLWYEFAEGSAIPVFIGLPSVENPATQLLQEYFNSEHFTEEEIGFLHRNHSFVFILDGYDEMNSTPNLYTTNHLNTWQAKVIISCRTQYLTQFVRYDQYFKPIQAGTGIILDSAFQELTVVPFNEYQIDAYITKYLSVDKDAYAWGDLAMYRSHINTISGLRELITTPFLLMIALKVMPAIVNQYAGLEAGVRRKITQSVLYDAFMQWWFRRGEIKALLNPREGTTGWHDITAEFQKMSEELAIEMKHADVMLVRYKTSEYASGKTYSSNIQFYELVSVTTAELSKFSLEENTMYLLYVSDCKKPEERWRIVARNNAGTPTYNSVNGWLTLAELARRWSARTTSIPAHKEQICEKARALAYAENQLRSLTPKMLSTEIKENVFHAIVLGLTHPWDYFFDLNNTRVQRLLPGIPVRPGEHGGYVFIHAEILRHFYSKAIKREETQNITAMKKKPWDLPPAMSPITQPTVVAFPKIAPAVTPSTTVIQQTFFQPVPITASALEPALVSEKSCCNIS